jgi:uncharacterized protein YjbI with pentapeptide repeats
MANPEHIERLKQGVEAWNTWRRDSPELPDLSLAKLRGDNLSGFDLSRTNLLGATLSFANLVRANLGGADLRGAANLNSANLSGADLSHVSLGRADLTRAKLCGARLFRADLYDAILTQANLTEANLIETVFTNVDLSSVIGLDTCIHYGPSVIDHRTLQNSGPLPPSFLRGVGLPERLIDSLPSLLGKDKYHSCFISYSTKDQEFADRLHADLQNKGVRCWFAPHDLPIGKDILEGVDAAIRVRDKVLLILSEHSIGSGWVKDEVNIGFEEERKRGRQDVLFPLRLDDAVMTANEAWAAKLRQRNIGDFRRWEHHGDYKQSFERVLRDLTKPRDGTQKPD